MIFQFLSLPPPKVQIRKLYLCCVVTKLVENRVCYHTSKFCFIHVKSYIFHILAIFFAQFGWLSWLFQKKMCFSSKSCPFFSLPKHLTKSNVTALVVVYFLHYHHIWSLFSNLDIGSFQKTLLNSQDT